MTAAPFIYLGGPPGVGKQTVAYEIIKLIPDCRIIDNHLLIDLCRAIFPQGSAEYETLRTKLRTEMLKAIVDSESVRQTTFIFTGAHMASAVSPPIARSVEQAAKDRGSPFISVRLSCEQEEHLQRLVDPDRVNPGKNKKPKLIKQDVLLRILGSGPTFAFGCEHETSIDTTGKSAEEVALQISKFVSDSLQSA